MKILHLLASPYFSGPMELVTQLALAQRELGHEVTVAVDRRRTQTDAEELAVPRLAAAGLLDEGGLELSVKSSPGQVWKDLRALHARKADVVHAHFSHDHFLMRLARPGSAVRVRSIHAARSLRWSLPAADAYTVPTEAWLERLDAARPRAVLPALVGKEFAPPSDRTALRTALDLHGEPLIGMVSTFQPSRRHALGLEAFRLLRQTTRDARLVLVGDGALEPELRKKVQQDGLDTSVVFAGYQRGEDFVRWLSALDELWILGLGNDFSARAAAQARRCGVRVVAVDEGALASYADAVTAPAPEAIVAASRSAARRSLTVQEPTAIAAAILELYASARRRA